MAVATVREPVPVFIFLQYGKPYTLSSLESSDSSVVTRWTVDQEIVGSNPTHGGNFISVVRSLSWFTQPIR